MRRSRDSSGTDSQHNENLQTTVDELRRKIDQLESDAHRQDVAFNRLSQQVEAISRNNHPQNATLSLQPQDAPQSYQPQDAPQSYQPQNAPQILQPQDAPQSYQPQDAPQSHHTTQILQPQNAPQSHQPQSAPQSYQPQNAPQSYQPQTATQILQAQNVLQSYQPQSAPQSHEPQSAPQSYQPQNAPQSYQPQSATPSTPQSHQPQNFTLVLQPQSATLSATLSPQPPNFTQSHHQPQNFTQILQPQSATPSATLSPQPPNFTQSHHQPQNFTQILQPQSATPSATLSPQPPNFTQSSHHSPRDRHSHRSASPRTHYHPYQMVTHPKHTSPAKETEMRVQFWEKDAYELIELTPIACEWYFECKRQNVDKILSSGDVLRSILAQDVNHKAAHGGITETQPPMLSNIEAYAQEASSMDDTIPVAAMVARFEKFLVLSICAVIDKVCDMSKDQHTRLLGVVKTCLNSHSTLEQYPRRMIETAVWMNKLIDELDTRGWSPRASELIFMWNKKPNFYQRLSRTPKSIPMLVTALTQEKYLNPTPPSPPLPGQTKAEERFVPFVVSLMVRSKVHISIISRHLNYQKPMAFLEGSPKLNSWLAFNLFSFSLFRDKPATPTTSASSTAAEPNVMHRSQDFSKAIGKSLSADNVSAIRNRARRAQPVPLFVLYDDIPFIYEHIESPGWEDLIAEVVRSWTTNKENIVRAEKCMGRPFSATDPSFVRVFCLVRFKPITHNQKITATPDVIGVDTDRPQTVIFIALDDLSTANGFFMTLNSGEDVCLDGAARIDFPSTGGGTAEVFGVKWDRGVTVKSALWLASIEAGDSIIFGPDRRDYAPLPRYNRIRLLEEQSDAISDDVLETLGALFFGHKVHNHYGLALLHRHVKVDEDYIMVHSRENDIDTCELARFSDVDAHPCAYFSPQPGTFIPFEFEITTTKNINKPLPTEFLADFNTFLWKNNLQQQLGLCHVSSLEVQYIENLLPDNRGTVARPAQQPLDEQDGRITEWGFLHYDNTVHVKALKACVQPKGGGHFVVP
ncbi:hypothetical protein FH972_024062 [Carpinus fangiana]|uniref:Uncharacterized protein n=1 Tax=Carpinus fangiana TaxID=176857 RepID=A0A5N6KZF5_9ROSI|nr:hypothetical protein FH972_024062 [Carpinus fangiana]